MSEDQGRLDGNGLTRRQALAAAAALCGFGAVTAAGTGLAQASGTLTVRLARFPALKRIGGVANVGSLDGAPVAVVRTGRSTYVALDRRCPHAGVPVTARGGGFICLPPGHGSQFTKRGALVSGPATRGLRRLRAKNNRGTLTISA